MRACLRDVPVRVWFGAGALLVVVLVLFTDRLFPSHPRPADSPVLPPDRESSAVPTLSSETLRYHATTSGGILRATVPTPVKTSFQSPLPSVEPPLPRQDVITYTVQTGDHLASIAAQFGLRRETLIWSNPELEPDPGVLRIGQVLTILPVDGVYYTVLEGDSLAEIAQTLSSTVETIVDFEYNGIDSAAAQLVPGQQLVVPGGIKAFNPMPVQPVVTPVSTPKVQPSDRFLWPVKGVITQGYWDLHRAIDIDGREGQLVRASAAGTVIYASWDLSGYGYLVMIDHGNGYVTYYAHLFGFYVDVGDVVEQGLPIGALGDTGNSTGPHLHFEIRKEGVHLNPLGVLPEE